MKPVLRAVVAALFLLLLLAVANKLHAVALIARGAELARSAGPLGALAVCGVMFSAMLLLLPMVPMVMAAGWIYGMAGGLLSLVAVVSSAAVAFEAGRALGRTRFQGAIAKRPRLRALAELAERGGIVTVALLRVSPLLPFTPSNAVLGMTSLRLRDLLLGTFVGVLPGGLLYTGAGALLPDAAALERGEAPRTIFWVMLAIGLASMAVIGTAAARKLREAKVPVTRA